MEAQPTRAAPVPKRESLSIRVQAQAARRESQRLHYLYRRNRAMFITTCRGALPSSIRDVIETIAQDLNRRLTLAQVASSVHRSPWHLNVAFHRETGMTIHDYATCLRMTRAAREIRRGVKVEAVASALGYASRQSFYDQFKVHFDTSPATLRPAHRPTRTEG